MEKMTYKGNQKKIEIFLLIMYSIYTIGIIVNAGRISMENWVDMSLIAVVLSSWFLFICKYKTYQFRATYTSVMMQISLILYTFYEKDLRHALPVYIVFVVMVGLYGIASNIMLTTITTLIVFGYHTFGIGSVNLESTQEIVGLFQRFSNVLFVQFLIYVWTKKNYEGSKALLEVIEELEKAESSKDDFVANVSHEIRTPINTICGMSEMILSTEIPYHLKEKVLDIQSAGRNLMGVVSDILDFSELQSGNIELEEESYNISSTINDVINMAMAYKNDKKIELIVDCDPGIPSGLMGDEKKLRRVILKLLNNAIKFTETGCVTLIIGYRKESYGINLSVTIKDTGIGIKEESLERLFTTFNQVDASRKRQEGGLGLGLAISQALVQKMGGAITVKSKWKKGTTVRFVVPQKVVDETPIATLHNTNQINVATYIDMEQFGMVEIRDEYSNMIIHMAEKLRGRCHMCRNLAELQRRNAKEYFSHIFISNVEYLENTVYFDELAKKTKVVVVLEQKDEKEITNPQLLKIYKPFYILAVTAVLNGEGIAGKRNRKMETRNVHVLVVDDNHMNLRVIEEMLATYHIRVTKADSGQEALKKIVTMNYDFIFMDYMMPEMDGVETLHKIRQKVGTYYQTIPVIALTANTVAGTREQLLQAGFTDFLEKPIERSVLERVLKRNLPEEKIMEKIEVQEEITEQEILTDWEEAVKEAGLDMAKAIRYCNGKEAYYKILQGYCKDGDLQAKQLEEVYRKQDWKNYTIIVHGLKSAMFSIGAEKIANQAKELENAGKKEDFAYILKNHINLLEDYQHLLENLKKHHTFFVERKKEEASKSEELEKREETQENCSNGKVISEEEFMEVLEGLEKLMYTLDGEKMFGLVDTIKEGIYQGRSLSEIIAKVQRKIEMSDYISAVEMLIRWKEQVLEEEK